MVDLLGGALHVLIKVLVELNLVYYVWYCLTGQLIAGLPLPCKQNGNTH